MWSIILLELIGCSSLPPFPEVMQSGYSYKYKKFRACNTDTHVCYNIPIDDPSMEGAQCLNAPDYKSVSQWVSVVKEIADKKCR